MAKVGWLSLIVGLAVASVACERPDSSTEQSEGDPEILAATESFSDFGDYVLHFNALTTDQLGPEIATNYDIVRSKNRVLLNISVLRNQEIGLATAVSGKVTASARNLTGQLRNLSVREVREEDAIYYIAETSIVNAETLIFTVEATPESQTTPLTVSFQKQFFVDE